MMIKILLSTLALNIVAVSPGFYQYFEQSHPRKPDSFERTITFSKNILHSNRLSPPTNEISVLRPIPLEWGTLVSIKYKLRYFEQLDMELYSPLFSEDVKALDGKEVAIRGYIIPMDTEGKLYALSANPFASCFFCGQASPASVISLYFKNKPKRYTVDDIVKFQGTLHLNYDDPDENYYVLKDAQAI